MKKYFVKLSFSVLIGIVVLCNTAVAQKLNAAKLPAAVTSSFNKSFPGVVNVKWELEDKNYEAGFKQDGKTMSAVIDAKGNLLETETDIAIKELPASVKNYIAANYKGAKIKEAAIIKKAAGEIIYEAEVNHKDILFNAKGEFIKETKD